MAVCVQCGREFASDRPGICGRCVRGEKEDQQSSSPADRERAHELIANHELSKLLEDRELLANVPSKEIVRSILTDSQTPKEFLLRYMDAVDDVDVPGVFEMLKAHPGRVPEAQVFPKLLEKADSGSLPWEQFQGGIHNWPYLIFQFKDKFSGLDLDEDFAQAFLKNHRTSHRDVLIDALGEFHDLSFSFAQKIVSRDLSQGDASGVCRNLGAFRASDRKNIFKQLLVLPRFTRGNEDVIEAAFDMVPGLDGEIARSLFHRGLGDLVLKQPERFGVELDAGFVDYVCKENLAKGRAASALLEAIDVFGEDQRDLVLERLSKVIPARVVRKLSSWESLDNQVALSLLDRGQVTALKEYLQPGSKQFPHVDRGVIVRALSLGGYSEFRQDLDRYPEADLPKHEQQIWDFFTDERVPRRIKSSQEIVDYLREFDMVLSDANQYDERQEQGADFDSSPYGISGLITGEIPAFKPNPYKEDVEQESLAHALRARLTHGIAPIMLSKLRKQSRFLREDPGAYERAMATEGWSEERRLAKIFGGDPKDPEIRQELAEWLNFSGDWSNDITLRFQAVLKEVGGDVLLDYLNRPDLSVHDALEFFDYDDRVHTLHVHEDFLRPELLRQVASDNAAYEEGTAHHRFKVVYQALSTEPLHTEHREAWDREEDRVPIDTDRFIEQTIRAAKTFADLEELQDLVRVFEAENSGPFDSWKALKKFHELAQVVRKTEVLTDLSEGGVSPRLRTFIAKLAFHPNIAMARVMQFWKEPAEFLHINDEHTGERVNAAKKPSNYLSLPYLGLRAVDLRDAYVEGALDKLQLLPPMEMTMRVGVENNPETSSGLHHYLREAVGQARKGIPPKAQRGKALFEKVQRFCRAQKVSFRELWDPASGPETISTLSSEARQELRDLVFEDGVGMKMPDLGGEEYRIRIGLKSDPDMTVAGNDTASCMPFGSGKNNVYMFNPNCVQLVVERKKADGDYRTAAQSVVTIDLETSHSTPDLVAQYEEDQTRLKDLLNDQDLLGKYVVTCDNIEVARNEEGQRVDNIREVYERFFEAYLGKHAQELGLDPRRVVVGQAYTPDGLGLSEIDNTFVPLAPMGYSDNVGAKSYVIETGTEVDEDALEIISRGEPGISPLQIRDVIPVAVLEGKAFADNKAVLENLHGMQNNLIGMRIANEHFGRPNLSFMYRDAKGVPRGYMLAYEGRNGDLEEVYIADIASDVGHPSGKLAGGQLIRQFFESYTTNYGNDKKPFLPIAAEARGETSYRILQRQLERLAKRADLQAEMVVVDDSDVRQGETFYHVRVFVGRDQEEIDAQKARFDAVPLMLKGVEDVGGDGETDYQYDGDPAQW